MTKPAAETMNRAPEPRAGIEAITPYKGGESAIEGQAAPVKLSSNENPLGCSPAARAALIESAERLALYPDGAAAELREALARAHALDVERIACGSGSDELIQILARGYAGPGDEILFSQYGFLSYRLAAMQAGATPVTAPEREYRTDVDAMLAAVTPRTKIVYVANPNNPTGSYLPGAELRRLHAGLRPDILLVIDCAYTEYLDKPDYEDGLALAREDGQDNIVTLRTFSKIYGLAACRIGWCFGPARVIGVINRMRGPFNVNAPALAAAHAALGDADFLAQSKAHNAEGLAFFNAEAERLGVLATPSVGNFVLLRFADAQICQGADAALRAAGLILRGMQPYGLPDCLRASVGLEADNKRVMDVLASFLSAR